ncbi:DUF1540 domain-containing protein [Clostridium sp. CS001]|uniref:DUF1540 domain-containing protein n=1 Tax=Clostridium sp. CS001 TaxID=2880648 RepID=UPI001CF17477|nr:DUF1540 domain-containing protein [Clostridium sp. CS001]MCB2290515.1 DUF1540 domain-containing protein [Clostridium sp. CS001]
MIGTLSCSATRCVNNMSGICSASNINVSGANAHSTEETQCETFAEKGLKNSLTNVLNMNVIGEIKQAFNHDIIKMSPSIKCEATNCVHNEKDLCIADNIIISGIDALNSERTQCETFKE